MKEGKLARVFFRCRCGDRGRDTLGNAMDFHRTNLLLRLSAFVALAAAASTPVFAQRGRRAPEPIDHTLVTRDGVSLAITYFPSDAGQDATTVVLLHDFGESRAVMRDLAAMLQSPGADQGEEVPRRAVVTVDLRGHGDSKTAAGPAGPVELSAARLRQGDFEDMIRFDMEAVRSFLVERNDARELNLNRLALVGSGMGANVATIWAAQDWDAPPLAVRKQGQDVKALALISPAWNFRGLALNDALRQPDVRARLSLLLAWGDDTREAARDAGNILRNVEKFHPDPPPDQVVEKKDLYVYRVPTKLQGTELLTEREFALSPKIDVFLWRRVDQGPFPWIGRKVK